MRIIIVGIFWSIFFLEGIRVIMLTNWRFDILRPRHWEHAWNLWLSGWVIDDPKEWAFVLIILTFIPLWLSGWAALSMIRYGRIFGWVMFFPLKFFNKIFEKPVKTIANVASVKVVKKKKSYKEIRPRSLRPPMDSSPVSMPQQPSAISATTAAPSHIKPAAPVIAPAAAPAKPAEFDHSLFQFDDEPAEFDFDLFDEKPKEKNRNRQRLLRLLHRSPNLRPKNAAKTTAIKTIATIVTAILRINQLRRHNRLAAAYPIPPWKSLNKKDMKLSPAQP